MKHNYQVLYFIIILTNLTRELNCNPESYWKTFIPWSSKKLEKVTETITVQFNHPSCTIIVNNTVGKITVKTWEKEIATIEIQKSATEKEAVEKINIEKIEKKDFLSLTTQEGNDQQVDYLLLVPSHANLQLHTKEGDIQLTGHFFGKVSATSEKGSITMDHNTQLFLASTTKSGNITVLQADGPVNTSTVSGTITIKSSKNSVIARTGSGAIAINAHTLPSTSKIDAKTINGPVTLKLDENINADLQVNTQKGTVISSIPVTLKSHTTTLGPDTWNQFKKGVDGTIGSGESLIRISCTKGSINIAPLKA